MRLEISESPGQFGLEVGAGEDRVESGPHIHLVDRPPVDDETIGILAHPLVHDGIDEGRPGVVVFEDAGRRRIGEFDGDDLSPQELEIEGGDEKHRSHQAADEEHYFRSHPGLVGAKSARL